MKFFILESAVGGIIFTLRMVFFYCSKLIWLQPINSPFGLRQYRLSTLHFAKNSNEIDQSRLLRTLPTADFRFMACVDSGRKRLFWARLSNIALGILILSALTSCEKEKAVAPRPPVVEVAEVMQRDVPVEEEWVGTTDGLVNAVIRAQVQGYLIKQNYIDGQFVRKGQILFKIDPRPFQATLDQAKSNLAIQEALWETAKANLNRIRPLAAQNAVSRKDLDDAVGREQSTRASVESAQAAVEKARLDLEFTNVASPIDGIAGIAKAQIGNLVGPGAVEELTTVSSVNPIKVYIQISEQEYLKYAERQRSRGESAPLNLILADGRVYPHKGKFAFADRQVDVRTGTIRVASLFPNPGNVLRPGQFAKVRAEVGVEKGALLVPQRAVTEMQGKYMLAVVGNDNRTHIRLVKVGARMGAFWIIKEGVKQGEKVVAEGVQKVKDGALVTPKPYAGEVGAKSAAISGNAAEAGGR
jgi:membrane fusion protein (multidrug efflux system)